MNRVCVLIILAAILGCRATSSPGKVSPDGLHPGYELVFSGNDSFSNRQLEAALEEELADFDSAGPTRPGVDDAAYSLEEYYRGQGFHEALVTYSYEAEDPVRIEFIVKEGPRAFVDKVRLDGDLEYDEDTLIQAIGGPRAGLLAQGDLYFVETEVRSGIASIRSFYFAEGYLTAKFTEPEITFNDARTKATVRVAIVPGPRFRIATIHLEGELDEWRAEIDELAEKLIRRPFTPRVPYSLRASIAEYFSRRGYPDPVVTFRDERDEATGDVTIWFTVAKGELVTIKDVVFEGQDRTKLSFLHSRLAFKIGEIYDGEKVRKTFRNLYRTGLFESVDMDLIEEEGPERTFRIKLAEGPPTELSVQPGYGSYEGPRLTLGAEYKNFLGSAKTTRFETTASPKALGAIAGITDPFLFGSDLTGSANLIYSDREEPSYTSRSIGTILSVSKQWTRKWRNSFIYTFRDEKLRDVDVDDSDAQDELDDVDVSSFSIVTTRTSVGGEFFFPDDGSRGRLTVEWGDSAFGSEIDFYRIRLDESSYHAFGEKSVIALSLKTGVIVPIGSTDRIPLQERFFNGGENTVRSFKESELGPEDDDGDPRGGEAFTVLSAEWRRRLTGNFSTALFYDSGNVTEDYSDYFKFENFSTGVGVGIRYMLPIGPLRLDVAVNPDPERGEDDVVAHFAVGMSF